MEYLPADMTDVIIGYLPVHLTKQLNHHYNDVSTYCDWDACLEVMYWALYYHEGYIHDFIDNMINDYNNTLNDSNYKKQEEILNKIEQIWYNSLESCSKLDHCIDIHNTHDNLLLSHDNMNFLLVLYMLYSYPCGKEKNMFYLFQFIIHEYIDSFIIKNV
jgi:hypothetical protein